MEAGEPFDLVAYIAVGEHAGSFLHYPDGEARPDRDPERVPRPRARRPHVILKLHGAVDRHNAEHDSYVITEDHYIDYLARPEFRPAPVTLAAKLRRSHFLFLGYSLRDWNLRVILHRIWGEQRLRYRSWAVQLDPEEIDRRFWEDRDVDIFDVALEEYVSSLAAARRPLRRSGAMSAVRVAAPPAPARAATCPYRGLLPFSEADARYFFGRDADRELIAANLIAARLTLLYAPSGVGKTSVLLAGVRTTRCSRSTARRGARTGVPPRGRPALERRPARRDRGRARRGRRARARRGRSTCRATCAGRPAARLAGRDRHHAAAGARPVRGVPALPRRAGSPEAGARDRRAR